MDGGRRDLRPSHLLGERGVLPLGRGLLLAPRGPRGGGGGALVLIIAVVLKFSFEDQLT